MLRQNTVSRSGERYKSLCCIRELVGRLQGFPMSNGPVLLACNAVVQTVAFAIYTEPTIMS